MAKLVVANMMPNANPGSRVDLAALRSYLAQLGRAHTPDDVAAGLRAQGLVVSDTNVAEALGALRIGSIGAGVLEPLLRSPASPTCW
jgi:pilus assembly protein CpaF